MATRKPSRRAVATAAPSLVAPPVPPVPPVPPINPWEYPSVGVQVFEDVQLKYGIADHTISLELNPYGDVVLRARRGYCSTEETTGSPRRTETPLISLQFDQDEKELDLFVSLLRNALDAYPRLKAIRAQMKAQGASTAA